MRLTRLLSVFSKDSNGGVVEMAFAAPLLLLLSMGIYDINNYIALNTKLEEAASSVANWAAANTTLANINDSLVGVSLLAKDYNFSANGSVIVSGIQTVTSNGSSTQQVVWQVTTSGSVSSIVTASGNVTSSPFPIANQPKIIVVEVKYNYAPFFSYLANILPTLGIKKMAQSIPRGAGAFSPLPAS